jgi:hypothetical protein
MNERHADPSMNERHADHIHMIDACLRARHDPDALRLVRGAIESGRVTWDALGQQLVDGRLEGMVYPVLCHQPWVPPAVLVDLRQAYAGYAVRNTVMLAALATAASQLAAVGIPTLALKGAALIESVYPSVGQRPMNDLDILVPAGQAAAAADVLRADGYAWGIPTDLAAALEFENELMLRRPGPIDIVIELHWHLINAPYYQRRMPMAWFWETSRPLSVNGVPTRMLGPEAQILHLCGHLVLHHGQGIGLDLRLLADVSELVHLAGVAENRIDWDLVLGQARAWDLVIALQRVLPDAAARLGAPIPAAVLGDLGRLRPSTAERRVVATLTAENPSVAQCFWADVAGLSGGWMRLRFIWRNLLPTPEYMRQRYGRDGAALPWAYLYRWCLGLRGAAWSVMRRAVLV